MQKYGTSIFIKQSQPKRNNSQKGPHSCIPLLLFADNVINIPVNSIEWQTIPVILQSTAPWVHLESSAAVMQLKSCWHTWESVTAIPFRNNSSFSVPCRLRQSFSLAWEPGNPKFWLQFWLLLWFFSEDLIISWRLSLKVWKRRGMQETRCDYISSQLSQRLQHLQRCSSPKYRPR